MKKCPDCGMTIANQAIRCPKCKYDFTDGQGNVQGVPTASSSSGSGVTAKGNVVGAIMPMIMVTKDNVDELERPNSITLSIFSRTVLPG